MNKFFQFNVYVELGKVFKDCEAYLIALEYFDRAIEIDPGYRDGFHNRGLAYSDLNELDLALQNLDTAINIDPYHSASFRHRSIVHHMLGNNDSSYRDYINSKNL